MSQSTSSGAGKFFNADFFKSFTPANTMFPVDFASLFELPRKNMQAMIEAQQIMVENMQTVAKRQAQLLTQMVEDQTTVAQQIMSEGTPEEKFTRQTDMARSAYERSVSNFNELTDLLNKSSREAGEVLNKRVTASLTEFKDSVEKAREKAAA
ncbi:MAG: phasin family protein [Micavibrio sp.]|nr:phasin family protein [Micavibrio sp.]